MVTQSKVRTVLSCVLFAEHVEEEELGVGPFVAWEWHRGFVLGWKAGEKETAVGQDNVVFVFLLVR